MRTNQLSSLLNYKSWALKISLLSMLFLEKSVEAASFHHMDSRTKGALHYIMMGWFGTLVLIVLAISGGYFLMVGNSDCKEGEKERVLGILLLVAAIAFWVMRMLADVYIDPRKSVIG